MIADNRGYAALFTITTLLAISQISNAGQTARQSDEDSAAATTVSGTPLEGQTLAPGETVSFRVKGASPNPRVSARPNPVSGQEGTLHRDGDIYRFTAPASGAFAGPYPIDIAFNGSDRETIRLRVPPVVKFENRMVLAGGDPLGVAVHGIVPDYRFHMEALEPTTDAPHLAVQSRTELESSKARILADGMFAGQVMAPAGTPAGRFRLRLTPQDGRYVPVVVDGLQIAPSSPIHGRIQSRDGSTTDGVQLTLFSRSGSASTTADDSGRFTLMAPRGIGGEILVSGHGFLPHTFDLHTFRQANETGPLLITPSTAHIDIEIVGLTMGGRVTLQLLTHDGTPIPSHDPVPVRGDGSGSDILTLATRQDIDYSALRISGNGYQTRKILLPDGIASTDNGERNEPLVIQAERVTPVVSIGNISISNPQGGHWSPNAVVSVIIDSAGQTGTVVIHYGKNEDDLSQTSESFSYREPVESQATVDALLDPLECGTRYYGEATATNDLGQTSEAVSFEFRTGNCSGSDPSAFSCALSSETGRVDPTSLLMLMLAVAGLTVRYRDKRA